MIFPPPTQAQDEAWMEQALSLAMRGQGLTSPNPPVGALIIQHRDHLTSLPAIHHPAAPQLGEWQLIGASYHQRAGEAHAERRALLDARQRGYSEEHLCGACIYITLEPCSSWGRTPPCTDAIIEASLSRVVYACCDPDTRHQGRAKRILEQQGIEVVEGVFKAHCAPLLRPWFFAIQHKRPWVVAKVATSLDARLSRRDTPWLSGAQSLHYAHQLRAQSDAILIGGGTLRSDDPSLTIRLPEGELPEGKQQPWRVIVSREADIAAKHAHKKIFSDEHAARTLVYTAVEDWEELLHSLYREHGVIQLMLECGASLLKEWLERGLIQQWVQIITPHLAAGPHELLAGEDYLALEPQWEESSWSPSGADMIYRALIAPRKDVEE